MNSRSLMSKVGSVSKASGSSDKSTIKVQQYDNGIKIFFYIKKDGIVESITGATIHLKFMNKINNVVMNRKCEITDAELGECLYTLTFDDLQHTGNYTTEVQVDYANGTVLSLDNPFTLVITPEYIPRN